MQRSSWLEVCLDEHRRKAGAGKNRPQAAQPAASRARRCEALRVLNAHVGLRLMEANGLQPPTLSAGLSAEQLAQALPPVLEKLSLTSPLFADCNASHRIDPADAARFGRAQQLLAGRYDAGLGASVWNDPVREANTSRNIPPEELAAQTQLFTERYGQMAASEQPGALLAGHLCQPRMDSTVKEHGVLDALAARRSRWRALERSTLHRAAAGR